MPINRRHHNLAHAIGRVLRACAIRAASRQLIVQGVDIIDFEIAKVIVRADFGGWRIVWTSAQHDPYAVTLHQPPIRRFLPVNFKPHHFPEKVCTPSEVWDRKHKGPRSNLRHMISLSKRRWSQKMELRAAEFLDFLCEAFHRCGSIAPIRDIVAE
jgi:hypothetical protein